MPQYDPDPDEPAPAKVYVGGQAQSGQRLPLINEGVTVHHRKDGPLAQMRLSDVHFPAEGFGVDWLDELSYSGPTPPSLAALAEDTISTVEGDVAEVWLYDAINDSYTLAHRGYVTGVGGGGQTNDLRLRIESVGNYLSELDASQSFSKGTVGDFLGYVVDELEARVPHFDRVNLLLDGDVARDTLLYEDDRPDGVIDFISPILVSITVLSGDRNDSRRIVTRSRTLSTTFNALG